MKKKYAKPSISIDIFEANEYIATCINAICNVDVDDDDDKNVMYVDRNKMTGYQKGDTRIRIDNDACGTKFTGKLSDLKSYMYDSDGTKDGGKIMPVYYWKVPGNHHVTTGYTTSGSSTA